MPTLFLCWIVLFLLIGELSKLSSCLSLDSKRCHKDGVLGTVRMDYSAANEYIRAHYGDQSPRMPLYFEKDLCQETVYDARHGVFDDDGDDNKQPASLKTCGFALVMNEYNERNFDWNNMKWIQQHYLPQLQKHLTELYSMSNQNPRTIRHVLFWNPMLRGPKSNNNNRAITDNDKRGKGALINTPKASYAALPHIDMDVNAYTNFEDFLDLMENNEVQVLEDTISGKANIDHQQRRRDILDSIQNKNCGFCIVNAWCNVGTHPVVKDPLGLFSVRYDPAPFPAAFPVAAPNMKTSRWYAYSSMVPNEVLFFCQYDRDVSWPSDLWHCSLNFDQHDDGPPRESFDIRCLLVFEEEVPLEQDRFQRASRLGSLLSLEESGCFCEGQFEKRLKEETVGSD